MNLHENNGSAAITYKISTQYNNYEHEQIQPELIAEIISTFETDPDNFIVLEPSAPIEGSLYMQAILEQEDWNNYTVELRIGNEESFKHYSLETSDRSEVIQMFVDYWSQQKLPDWTGWKDITDQF